MTLTFGSIEGKQLDLYKGNIIFYHVDSFCLQERKRKMKREVFSDPYTEATVSAKTAYDFRTRTSTSTL